MRHTTLPSRAMMAMKLACRLLTMTFSGAKRVSPASCYLFGPRYVAELM